MVDMSALHTGYEAFGIVLAEAMASGKPAISTRAGAVPEVVDDGKTGMLVPPFDSEALADTILEFVTNQEEAAEMAAQGGKRPSNSTIGTRLCKSI